MKVQSNPIPTPVKKNRIKKDLPGSLSSDAFYLIALAMLFQKESGGRSMRHYLFPKITTATGRSAA